MFNRVEEIADGQLIVSQGEGVALLELNRPDSFNALSVSLLDALVAALSTLSEDPTVSAIVLTGRGKAFSVGVDLKELASGNGLMESGELGPVAV
ncbi:hypothetical protein BST95_12505 [Halioglobus japonicus]|uniref:enoyl-CoA hydratase/isomerase family protein n=1 Tax=Halioglobus japonicus TaxID=930805 RepID=UPI0009794627|nr:enoyl-CoA hydratase-related protein [Halioglobus japonicus]AQA18937.1 hypothetical protein BST95_12505 [Halioglobus japonicus]